jgi:hypothetical protein
MTYPVSQTQLEMESALIVVVLLWIWQVEHWVEPWATE